MSENRKLTILFVLLGNAFIAGGMVLKDYGGYLAIIGWLGGLVFLLFALRFVVKWARDENE
ncbi:hypothetical protein [Halalkalibacter urbisdiaboli]|uniref:hypothetical protein n=1 Tax=Halalkalibacter urbisdiaboli TaxID=1960589 RepID=UPI000B43CCBC|nr:hypothetical protein [Halalkalibacter urbisdiaboli]